MLTALLSEDAVCMDGSVRPQELMPERGSWTDSGCEVRTSITSNAMQGIREPSAAMAESILNWEEILVHEVEEATVDHSDR